MKRVIIASHHNFAKGLKETLAFLTTMNDIYDITAYVDEEEEPLEEVVKKLMDSFDLDDKIIVMTDCLAGSVNQKFYPYINENVFLITGVNVPLGMSIMLLPEEQITKEAISGIVKEAKDSLIFVNEYNTQMDNDDE